MDKAQIVELLRTNDKALCRALVLLNLRQEADEQVTEQTRYRNGKGFRPCHAKMGTSMAKFYQTRGFLTEKQIAYWRKPMACGNMKIGIYAGQLLEEAAAKAARINEIEEAMHAIKNNGTTVEQTDVIMQHTGQQIQRDIDAAELAELDAYMKRVKGV